MENKSEMMEAIMMGNSINMQAIEDLWREFNVSKMLKDYYTIISNRNNGIEVAKPYWKYINEEGIKSENAKVEKDSKKITKIEILLDELKKLIEEE